MRDWLRSILLPAEGTSYAGSVDSLFFFLFYMGVFFFLLIAGLLGTAAPAVMAQAKTLKVVAHADVKILDPSFTTA